MKRSIALFLVGALFLIGGCAAHIRTSKDEALSVPISEGELATLRGLTTPVSDHAVVIIYRPGEFVGGGRNWNIKADGTEVDKLSNKSIFRYVTAKKRVKFSAKEAVSPVDFVFFPLGPLLSATAPEIDMREVDLGSNRVYYMKFSMNISWPHAIPSVIEVPENVANREISEIIGRSKNSEAPSRESE